MCILMQRDMSCAESQFRSGSCASRAESSISTSNLSFVSLVEKILPANDPMVLISRHTCVQPRKAEAIFDPFRLVDFHSRRGSYCVQIDFARNSLQCTWRYHRLHFEDLRPPRSAKDSYMCLLESLKYVHWLWKPQTRHFAS